MKRSNFIFILSLLFYFFAFKLTLADTIVVGKMGNVYPVAEKSAYTQILDKAKKVNWKKVIENSRLQVQNEINTLHPEYKNIVIKNATKNYTYYVTIMYTLDRNIANAKGQIIYPKGYTFNVMDYVHMDKPMIFFNANDPKQVAWFKKNFSKNTNIIAMITGGYYMKAMKETNSLLYIAPPKLIENLKITQVPCVATQAGDQMRVEVFDVDGK